MSTEQETQINKICRPANDDWINNLRRRNAQLYSIFSKIGDKYCMYQNFILSKLLITGEINLDDISATLNIIEGQIDQKTFTRAFKDTYAFTINQGALTLAIMKSDNDKQI
jgi:hypothetical protein